MIDIERQAPCREPSVGLDLDPVSPESCPGPKADAKLLSHPGIPMLMILLSLDSLLHLIYYILEYCILE